MQRIILFLTFFAVGLIATFAQDTYSITIEFSGMETDKGAIYVGLHDSKANFLKKRFKETVIAVKDNKATVTFENIPQGEYAVSAFHDENDNKKMDTKIFGIPKEPIGISNNASGFMGPPKYKDAKFIVDKDITLQIKMN